MINEILELDVSNESIKKINRFINKTSVEDENHAIAVSHLITLYYKTEQIDEILNIVDKFTKKYNNDNSIILLDKLIELSLNSNNEICLNAINQKKTLLKSYDLISYYEDMINYHKNNLEERIRYINLYLQDDPSKTNRLNGMFLLAKAYFENNQFIRYANKLDTTKELALELGNFDFYEGLVYFELETIYNENLEVALKKLNEYTVRTDYYGNKVRLLNFKINFKLGNYKKCSILEPQLEDSMTNASIDVQKEFYNTCIKLYTVMRNTPSVNSYSQKLQNLEYKQKYSKLDYVKDEQINSIKIKKEKKETKKIEQPIFKVRNKIIPTLNEMSDFYRESEYTFNSFFEIIEFREQVRLSLCILNEQIDFQDCYIVSNFESFHFKKERLYKKSNVNFDILKSFNNVNTEIFSFNTYKDNIIEPFTNEVLKYNVAVILPLFKEVCIGAIYFTAVEDKTITSNLNFEKLHHFCRFFNAISLINYEKERVVSETKSKLELINSDMLMYAYIDDDIFYCNDVVSIMLNCPMKTTASNFLSKIHSSDYFEFHKEYFNLDINSEFETLVIINNKNILIRINRVSEFKYLMTFNNYTQIIEEKKFLIREAYYNPITNLKNNKALEQDIEEYFSMKKFSAILVNFKDLKKYTYLYQEKFSLDILKLLGQVLIKFNDKYEYYHLNFDKLIILIKDTNDKRVLKQIVSKLDLFLIDKLSEINKRLIPKFTYGTYRSFVDTKEKSLDKMIEILSDSILNVSEFFDDNIGFYDIEQYKKRFLNEQLITYISEAIDNKNINVLFSQCINVKDNLVEYYEAKLNLNQYKVEDGLLQEIIKRKSLSISLEQYLIQRTFHEMNLIYDKTSFSINVVLHIDEYSFVKKSFINYIEEKTKQYKIDKRRVILKINQVYEFAVENISYLIDQGYQIALNNISDLSFIKPNYYLLDNFSSANVFNDNYIKTLCSLLTNLDVKFVLSNTNKNDVIEQYKESINYFIGDVYKQKLSYLDIINTFKKDLGI